MAEQGSRVGDLQINEDLSFQRRVWRFQTVGRVVMALVLLAALLGLLGPGLLSNGASADSRPQAGLGVRAVLALHEVDDAADWSGARGSK